MIFYVPKSQKLCTQNTLQNNQTTVITTEDAVLELKTAKMHNSLTILENAVLELKCTTL